MHRLALIVVVLFTCNPACAMVGETESLADFRSRPEAMILGTGKNLCSAVAIAPSLLLTAAHCIMPGDIYKRVETRRRGAPDFQAERGGHAASAVRHQILSCASRDC